MVEVVLALPRLKNDARIVFAFAYVAYGLFAIIEAAYSITLRMPSFPAGLALIAAQCIVLASNYGRALTAVESANLELEDRVGTDEGAAGRLRAGGGVGAVFEGHGGQHIPRPENPADGGGPQFGATDRRGAPPDRG